MFMTPEQAAVTNLTEWRQWNTLREITELSAIDRVMLALGCVPYTHLDDCGGADRELPQWLGPNGAAVPIPNFHSFEGLAQVRQAVIRQWCGELEAINYLYRLGEFHLSLTRNWCGDETRPFECWGSYEKEIEPWLKALFFLVWPGRPDEWWELESEITALVTQVMEAKT